MDKRVEAFLKLLIFVAPSSQIRDEMKEIAYDEKLNFQERLSILLCYLIESVSISKLFPTKEALLNWYQTNYEHFQRKIRE